MVAPTLVNEDKARGLNVLEARMVVPVVFNTVSGAWEVQGPITGGGGGGGAVTIANGADVALGSKADAPEFDTGTPASLISRISALLDAIQNTQFALDPTLADVLTATTATANALSNVTSAGKLKVSEAPHPLVFITIPTTAVPSVSTQLISAPGDAVISIYALGAPLRFALGASGAADATAGGFYVGSGERYTFRTNGDQDISVVRVGLVSGTAEITGDTA